MEKATEEGGASVANSALGGDEGYETGTTSRGFNYLAERRFQRFTGFSGSADGASFSPANT